MRRRLAAAAAAGATLALAPHGHDVRPEASKESTSAAPPGGPFVPHPSPVEVSRSAPLVALPAPETPTTTVVEPRTAPLPVRVLGHDLEVTAYCLSGVMADGQQVHAGAAASDLYPLGTHLEVSGFGEVTVEDRSAPGATDLDLWMPSCAAARQWGRRRVSVTEEAA